MMEWLNLLFRWTHLIAGIAWIGSSFYFVWLDSQLTIPEKKKEDVEGELWMVHSGGFYLVERKKIGPGTMPKTLHWFKYEALLTWISGFVLLNLVYYFTDGAYLIDPSIAKITPIMGTAIGIGILALSWFIYDFIWESKFAEKNNFLATLISVALASGAAIIFCKYLSGRAAFLHLGAMFGTIMVANVWVRILPSQQKMIDATKEGRSPDFSLSGKAKRRSIHNSYMTFPVLFLMLSNHYPNTYGISLNWLVLILLVIMGMAVRHVMIAKNNSGRWAVAPAVIALAVLIALTHQPSSSLSVLSNEKVSFKQVRAIVNSRCLQCHSIGPQLTQFGPVPGGMYFENSDLLHSLRERIRIRAVDTKTMPPQNVTQMSDEERGSFVVGRLRALLLSKFFIRSQRVVLSDGSCKPASLFIEGETISQVANYSETFGVKGIEAGNSVLMSGLIDTHVHINEPGRTEWEGFQTATQAAAAGGITALVDMPLNSIPATTEVSALEKKRNSARGNCTVDYGFWGGVIPGNTNHIAPLLEAGALGCKAFLIESGVDEFPMVTEEDLVKAMPILAHAGRPLLVHAELEGKCGREHADPRSYFSYLESRPAEWEVNAIRLMIRLSRETGCHVHIVHLSAADALHDIRRARAEGVKITAETCPHYLFFSAEEIPDGATQFKCAPPIRQKENRERLWAGLEDGTIDFIVSDHSPCTPKLKKLEAGAFAQAWGGISGLQFALPVVWTQMKIRDLPPEKLCEWMSLRTAAFLGLHGGIEKGHAANLVVWNPEKSFVLERKLVKHRHDLTPYEGEKLFGVVEKTFVRGSLVYDNQTSVSDQRIGAQI